MSNRSEEYVGQQLGNYRLIRLLRQGGFALVYLGEHVFLSTYAAIKILHTQLTQDEQTNFLNEARMIAHLHHPNIIGVMDFGMHDAIPFLVMDYASNGSLRDCHPRGSRVPLTLVVSYIKQVADALQYAHNDKLIHRDVKPENMLIGSRGEILLSDFGISIVAQTTQSQRTQEAIGTPPYMAPEQLQGKPRPASDQYALAVVAYEWLCGERPFQGGGTELFAQQLFTPPLPLREKNPMIPAEVEQVIMTGLSKDYHQRFTSVQAFARALTQASRVEPFLIIPTERHDSAAPPPSPNPTMEGMANLKPHPLAPTEPSPARGKAPFPPRLSRRAALFGIAGWAGLAALGIGDLWYALSPHYAPLGSILYLLNADSDTIRAVAWKGERIASASDDKTVKVWDATTGSHLITYTGHSDKVQAVSWSPDGSQIASASADNTVQIWSSSTGGSKPAFTYRGHAASNGSGVTSVDWSPKNSLIASGGNDGTVHVWDPTNGHTKLIFQGHLNTQSFIPPSVYTVAWSSDGKYLASGASDEQVLVWDAGTGRILTSYKHNGNVNSLSWSPDGTRIASASSDHTVQIWTISPGGTSQQTITHTHSDTVYSVAWSADGQHIASASADKTVQIWKPTTDPQTYTYQHHLDEVWAVAWSQDNHRVASGGKDTTVQVWEGI